MLRIRSCSKNSEMLKPFALLLILSAGLCLMTSGSVQAQASTEAEEAAEALLVEMDLETTHAKSIDQMIDVQIQMNPALAELSDTMKEIMADYFSFKSIKPFYIDLYVDTYTAAELRDLVAFYKSPVGKKSIVEMPAVIDKSAQYVLSIMQENAAEIGQRLMEAQRANAAPEELEI